MTASGAGGAMGLLRSPQKIIFGKGQRGALGACVAALGRRALVVTDARFAGDPAFTSMIDDIGRAGCAVLVFDRAEPELPLSAIADCTATAGRFSPDVVVGLGGGSCMDLAKAAALMLAHGGDIRRYYGEFMVPGPVLPLVLVPTTSGTGSEVTPVSVLGDPEKSLKVGIASPYLIANTAICDPELTYGCPAGLTAISGADALTHAIEAFTAIRRSATPTLAQDHVFIGKNHLSDHFALIAIERIGRSLLRAFQNGDDEDAREDLMFGALMAGLAFGTAGTAGAHAIQYPVGAATKTAHGAGVALLLPYIMDYNRDVAASQFVDVAKALGVRQGDRSQADMADAAVLAVASLFQSVGLPRTLSELGMAPSRTDWIVEQSLTVQRLVKNSPSTLDADALTHIVRAAFSGRLTGAAARGGENQ